MKFIILGNYRTGSTLLQKTISQHKLVEVGHEIFNLDVISRNLSILEDPEAHLIQHLTLPPDENIRAVGFKMMYCQARKAELSDSYWGERVNQRILNQIDLIEQYISRGRERFLRRLESVWEVIRNDSHIRILHIRRENLLASYLSFQLALSEDRWIDNRYISSAVKLDGKELLDWFERNTEMAKYFEEYFGNHQIMPLTYEDLVANFSSVMSGVFDFLEVPEQSIDMPLSKQQTLDARERISNYGELEELFSGTVWCDQFRAV